MKVTKNFSHIAFRKIGTNVFIKRIDTQKWFSLKGIGALIWEQIDFEDDIDAIIENITNKFGYQKDIQEDLQSFFTQLYREGIIKIDGKEHNVGNSLTMEKPNSALLQLAFTNEFPLFVDMELTYRCNFSCVYCYIKEMKEKASCRQEITAREIKSIFKQLEEIGTFYLSFTGGEPTLRKDFLDIFREARLKGFDVSLLTNGSNIGKEIVQEIKKYGISKIKISLYGSSPTEYENFTRTRGAFYKVLNNIKLLKTADLPVTVVLPITKGRVPILDKMKKIAKSLGVDYEIHGHVLPNCEGELTSIKYRLTNEEVKLLIKKEAVSVGTNKCLALVAKIRIDPYGNVYPCELIRIPLGSLIHDEINVVWNRRATKELRERIHQKPLECVLCKKKDCQGCPGISYIEHGSFDAPPEEICRWIKLREKIYNYKAFPSSHHRRIRTTNVLERVNKEIKRRTKEVGAFTNDASLVRLAVSILMDMDEEWITTRKYLNMDVEENEKDEENEIVA